MEFPKYAKQLIDEEKMKKVDEQKKNEKKVIIVKLNQKKKKIRANTFTEFKEMVESQFKINGEYELVYEKDKCEIDNVEFLEIQKDDVIQVIIPRDEQPGKKPKHI